jgi:putative transposase
MAQPILKSIPLSELRISKLNMRHSWNTRRETETALFQYINGFYNPRRRHSALGWKSPLAFERKAA